MMDLRILLFFVTVPWIFCEPARTSKVVPKHKGILKIVEDEELISESRIVMEAKKPKKKVILNTDYDSPADTDDESPGAGHKDDKELPTCLMCVCLTGSVYSTLRRIDLTGNLISEIEDGAFSKLNQLEELTLAENKLVKLPTLPAKLVSLNVNHNVLKTKGVKANIFKKLTRLAYLYLGDNGLEAVPPLPESLRVIHLHNNNITSLTDDTFCKGNNTNYIRYNMQEVRLDGNPITLAQHPNSFICLRALPIEHYK
ncbi:mimecan-like [Sinocyclocheilus rhinocerous]|uniref:mimecan-like n=1 Tax=Sinocyclocheilus rhinocerous TaxID=307959 RepID=UPI0007B8AE6E|nr:PREDICTED: mimecan-like [Sinocyclocheilus rhinocerous]